MYPSCQRTSRLAFLFLIWIAFTEGIAQTPSAIWGIQFKGGPGRAGLIFRTDLNGDNYTVTHTFQTNVPGDFPVGSLVPGPSGTFYGVHLSGGLYGAGLLYKYDPATGAYQTLVDFKDFHPRLNFLVATNGKIYGLGETPTNAGNLYEVDLATKVVSIKQTFPALGSNQTIMESATGKIYGLTPSGGANNAGTIYKYDPALDAFSTELEFGGSQQFPSGELLHASNGKMYGYMAGGGANSLGGVFEFDPVNKTINTKASFSSGTGQPGGDHLIELNNDLILGRTNGGGANGTGDIFELKLSTGAITSRYSFPAGIAITLSSDLMKATDGMIYGTSGSPVAGSDARLFQYNPTTFAVTVKYEFVTPGLITPLGRIQESPDHRLYSLCFSGGKTNIGGIYRFDNTNSQLSPMINFMESSTGYFPKGSFIQTPEGKLLGVSYGGGLFEKGFLYELDQPTGNITTLKNFDASIGNPDGELIEYNGLYYGVATSGGANNKGSIYSYNKTTNTLTNLVNLTGPSGAAAGENPYRRLYLYNGKFYGVTRLGGAGPNSGNGVIFEFDPLTNQYTVRYSFVQATGVGPRGFMLASNGKLYGLCARGGANSRGGLYEFDPTTGNYAMKLSFSSSTGGGAFSPPVEGLPGILHLCLSGSTGNGAIYEYNLTTGLAVLRHSFIAAEGAINQGGMLKASNGKLYGLSANGGSNGIGTWYEFDPVTYAVVKKTDMDGLNGAVPNTGTAFEATKINQTITFGSLIAKQFGDQPFDLSAAVPSGLPVTFTSSNPQVAAVVGKTVTIVGAGTTTITAAQTGNTYFAAATPVPQQFVVNKSPQTITFAGPAAHTFGDGPFSISATATSGLSVTFTSSNPAIASVSGTTVTVAGAGTAQLIANQTGDNNYQAAVAVVRDLVIAKASQVITFAPLSNRKTTDPPFTLTATSSSTLPVSFTSSNVEVATVTNSTVTLVGSGSTIITALQGGDANYAAAAPVAQSLNVILVTGIEGEGFPVSIYPNPVVGHLHVRLPVNVGKHQVIVRSTEGTLMDSFTSDLAEETIYFGNLSVGLYIVEVHMDELVTRFRVMKK